jgi:uncharacterized protein
MFDGFRSVLNEFMGMQAKWEIETSQRILARRKKYLFLAVLPILLVFVMQSPTVAEALPDKVPVLGGSTAFMPCFANPTMFCGSIFVGLIGGLIAGAIGAGGGYVLTPALMSFGVRGIMAVGTDQFHIFAEAIMGTTLHKKMGNVHLGLAALFVTGSLCGVTIGGTINRAIFAKNPAMSDALISAVYVIVLGIIGIGAIIDFIRLKNAKKKSSVEATTAFAKWLQSLPLKPMITFDKNIVPGGKKISIYPVILCGLIVGFVAAIMGVGGGFLTFPMFVYGLGVSTFTTVGTDLLQIIFTTSYSSIFQYAIYGFVFYTISIGMLLGSLIGVQIGAMVTKMITGARIRVFYALTILAGFANRACALPRKLADLGYISMTRNTSIIIERFGTVIFFAIIGTFALWVLAVFFKNVPKIRRASTSEENPKLIMNPTKLRIGIVGLGCFAVVLGFGLSPVYNQKNVLHFADNFFNQLAKNSVDYISQGHKKADDFKNKSIDIGIHPREIVDANRLAKVIASNGLEAKILDDGRVRIRGSLHNLAEAALADANYAFVNYSEKAAEKYQMGLYDVTYCWWNIFDSLTRRYNQENNAAEADFRKFMATKILEPAYNFRGIAAVKFRDNVLPVVLLLGFYVLYTLWYGFSILYIFEGLGISASAISEKNEI